MNPNNGHKQSSMCLKGELGFLKNHTYSQINPWHGVVRKRNIVCVKGVIYFSEKAQVFIQFLVINHIQEKMRSKKDDVSRFRETAAFKMA